jgi:hypothetical protein
MTLDQLELKIYQKCGKCFEFPYYKLEILTLKKYQNLIDIYAISHLWPSWRNKFMKN